MKFRQLTIQNWRQFSAVQLDFHERVTILTGANGAGKTTLLRLLSHHFGWANQVLATPRRNRITRALQFSAGVRKRRDTAMTNHVVGSITYSDGFSSSILVPENGGVMFQPHIEQQRGVMGVHIGSHRHQQVYQQIGSIPAQPIGAEQAFSSYFGELQQRFYGSHTQFSPFYRMKEALISMATFGPGNENVEPNPDLQKLFVEFKEILEKLLPPSVGFIDIAIRMPDVVLLTRAGDFLIDAASGGLSSIIEVAWQVFLFSRNKDSYCVTIDEPENHLHPSLQRSLIARLVDAFPAAQFIVVTHSPFVVSSVRDSSVLALKHVDESESNDGEESAAKKVISVRLDLDQKASSATEILREVLGVPVTLPEWAESDLKKIAEEEAQSPISEHSLLRLRSRLASAGLAEYFPQALQALLERQQ